MAVEIEEYKISNIAPEDELAQDAQVIDAEGARTPESQPFKEDFFSNCFNTDSVDLSINLSRYNVFLRSFYADKSNEVIEAVQKWAKDSKAINLVLNVGFNSYISSRLLKGEYAEAGELILEFLDTVEDQELQLTYLDSYALVTSLLRVKPAEFTSSGCDFLYRGEGNRGKINGWQEVDVTSRFFSTSRTKESAELFIRDNRDMLAIQVTKDRPVLGIPVPNHLRDLGITREIAEGRNLEYEKDGTFFGNFRSANNEVILPPNQSFTKGPRSINIGGRNYRPVVASSKPLHSSEWIDVENSLREKLS